MSPHLIQSVAYVQVNDRLRSAGRFRLAAQARARGSASAAQPSRSRRGRRLLRTVFA
jgi:hypothetical protein